MADEDDQWLYGDSNPELASTEEKKPELVDEKVRVNVQAPEFHVNFLIYQPNESELAEEALPQEDGEPGEVKNEEQREDEKEEKMEKDENGTAGDEEEEDEDSDEDNVNVVIGDISKSAPTYTNLNIHKRGAMVPAGKVCFISLEIPQCIVCFYRVWEVNFQSRSLNPWALSTGCLLLISIWKFWKRSRGVSPVRISLIILIMGMGGVEYRGG